MEPAETEITPVEFLDLPKEMQEEMLLHLDLNSILNLCAASIELREHCKSEFFWKQKTKLDFPGVTVRKNKRFWKDEYKYLWIDTVTKERRIAELLDLPSDTRFDLLVDLDYTQLKELCDFAKGRIAECDDENFWLHKLKHDFGTNHIRSASTWKEEYDSRYWKHAFETRKRQTVRDVS